MQERHNRESVVHLATHDDNQEAHKAGASPSGAVEHIRFNLSPPSTIQANDNELCIWPETDANLTIDKITVTLDAVGNEVAGDLKYADTFIGLANPVVINSFDTTNGFLADASITNGAVPAGKAIYIAFDSAPSSDITQMSVDIAYNYD